MRYGFGMARVGQQIAGLGEDRLPGQIAVGVLTKVFPPSLVDEVVAAAGGAADSGAAGPAGRVLRTLDMVRKFMQLEKATDTLIPAGPGSIAAGQRLAGSQVEL